MQSRVGSTLAPATRRERPAFDQETLLHVLSHRCCLIHARIAATRPPQQQQLQQRSKPAGMMVRMSGKHACVVFASDPASARTSHPCELLMWQLFCGCQGGPCGVQVPEERAPPAEADQQQRPGAEPQQPEEQIWIEERGERLISVVRAAGIVLKARRVARSPFRSIPANVGAAWQAPCVREPSENVHFGTHALRRCLRVAGLPRGRGGGERDAVQHPMRQPVRDELPALRVGWWLQWEARHPVCPPAWQMRAAT